MSVAEWNKQLEGTPGAERHSLDSTLTGLTKLLEALKSYPADQRLIVFGIVVLTIVGLYGGIRGL